MITHSSILVWRIPQTRSLAGYSPAEFTWSFVPDSLQALKECSMRGFPVHRQLLELAQAHVHRVSDAIQPSTVHGVAKSQT